MIIMILGCNIVMQEFPLSHNPKLVEWFRLYMIDSLIAVAVLCLLLSILLIGVALVMEYVARYSQED